MIHHLAGKTGVVFGYGSVLMKQAKTMEPNEAQQRNSDDPSAHAPLSIAPIRGHALGQQSGSICPIRLHSGLILHQTNLRCNRPILKPVKTDSNPLPRET